MFVYIAKKYHLFKSNYNLLFEFIRYLIVGGTAFIIDFSVLKSTVVFFNVDPLFGAFLGFCCGLIVNYVLSTLWVFKNANKNNFKDFVLFSIIGVIGLILTEIIIYSGHHILLFKLDYVKIFSTFVVLFWNYLARKFLIFKT